MKTSPRFIGLDVHRNFVVATAVDAHQELVFDAVKIPVVTFTEWAKTTLRKTDQVALETTSNAWAIYDAVQPFVANAEVADVRKIKLISQSPRKTDKHDALVLAKLLAGNLLPSVWVPPKEVRELRSLISHRRHLIRDRSATRNRLHSILHRHNLHLPEGEPFSQANLGWWEDLPISSTEQLRVRHDLLHIKHLSVLINEVEAEITKLSVQEPWCQQLAFLIQLPGIALLSGMTILSAIGTITRFPGSRQLVGYSGLGASVHASADMYRTGHITKQGRRELRTVLIESAWSAVRYSPFWKARYEQLCARLGKRKAIVAIARKLLVVIWHVLSKRMPDRNAEPRAIARSLMKWASSHRLATSSGMSRADFVWRELDRIGIGMHIDHFYYGGRAYHRTKTPVIEGNFKERAMTA